MRETKTIGRPREFDADSMLLKIMDVFWARGFEGTTLSHLVAATGLKKGSLYAAFGDKREMYLKALALYDRTAIDASVQLLGGKGAPRRRINAFLQGAIDAVAVGKDRRGCFLCNAAVDQAMLDRASGLAVKSGLKRLARALENALSEPAAGLANAAPRRAAAEHFLAVYFGLRVLAKAGHPVKALSEAKSLAISSAWPAG